MWLKPEENGRKTVRGTEKGELSEAKFPLSCRPTLPFLLTSLNQEKKNVRMHR